MIFTCPSCYQTLAVPDNWAGLLHQCAGRVAPLLTQTQAPSGAPSPAGAAGQGAPSGRSEGTWDGGRRTSESASGSPGRGGEKPSQRSPGASGGPIEAAPIPKELEGDWKPDRDAQERAEGWFRAKFFKSKGIGDEWKKIVAACKSFGMPDKVKWRDWLKEQWDTNRAVAVKVLITAGEIKDGFVEAANTGNPVSRAVLAALKADYKNDKGLTLDDLKAQGAPGATETHLTDLIDAGFVYTPLPGRYRAVEAK